MRRLALSLAALLAAAVAGTAHATGFARPVYVVNQSSTLTPAALADALPAFQTAVSRDFAPVWGVDAQLVPVASSDAVPAGGWSITIIDWAFYEGYHDYDLN